MPLPDTIRVKLSSEATAAITITPVVVRDMPSRELVEVILPATGKDAARIQELLRTGTFVSGASRFRWAGFDAPTNAVQAMLSTFPDPDPGVPFGASRCVSAVLAGPYARIELPREAGSKRRFLRRVSFWDRLLELAPQPVYRDYSYRDRADCFRAGLGSAEGVALRAAARLLPYPTLVRQIEAAALEHVDFYVRRAGPGGG